MKDWSDSFIARVERAVLLATHGRVGKLHVEHSGDVVVLHGRCPSLSCKMLAGDAALLLIGEAKLENKIEIH